MGYIYIIKNHINNKVYIGQTTKEISERWKEHLYNTNNRNQLIYSAMRKYGIENFYIEELEQVENNIIDNREIFWISKFNSVSPNGYNITNGGSKFKNDNPMFHDEIKIKVSENLKGDKNPSKRPEVREKIRKSSIGRKASEETKKKMSQNNGRYWKGKHLSDETRAKISKNHGCRGKFGGLNPASKKVIRIDKDTFEELEQYDSIVDATKWVMENVKQNANASNISQACHGKQKTVFGFIWKIIEN